MDFFKKLIYFNWRLITLQYCDFHHTSTWISHGCTGVPLSWTPHPPPSPPHPSVLFQRWIFNPSLLLHSTCSFTSWSLQCSPPGTSSWDMLQCYDFIVFSCPTLVLTMSQCLLRSTLQGSSQFWSVIPLFHSWSAARWPGQSPWLVIKIDFLENKPFWNLCLQR